LPVVPPVTDRVEGTLTYEGRPPEAVIATHPATGLQLSVHAAAVNAVMAGCLPEYFPVLIAAFEAMDKPESAHNIEVTTNGRNGFANCFSKGDFSKPGLLLAQQSACAASAVSAKVGRQLGRPARFWDRQPNDHRLL